MTADIRPLILQDSPPTSQDTGQALCLVCKGKYLESKLPGLFECEACGFISANLNISDSELEELYGKDYFHGKEYLDYIAEEDSLRLNFRHRISTLGKLIPDLRTKDLFEIGCAYGFFLDEVKSHVRSARGIDISADAVTEGVRLRGVSAEPGDYLSFDLSPQVDVITLWDTIEHLKDPDLFIEKVARDLKPGGHVALTTGDIGAFNARMRGARWRMIHPPTHLHYFSVPTISRLMDRCGFDIVHVSHPGNSRNLRSVMHFILALRLNQKKLYDTIAPLKLWDLAFTVNLYDIMFVVGQRR
jgi:SAM-dependent methyltransferase